MENHFDGIVKSIQDLLLTIRSDGSMDILRSQIFEIANIVGNVVDSTQSSMSFTGNLMLRERGQVTVKNLGECRTKMLEMAALGDGVTGTASKEFKAKLAGYSFDMAREIKVRTYPPLPPCLFQVPPNLIFLQYLGIGENC